MISCFANVYSPKVLGEIDLYTILDMIVSPDDLIKNKIIEARKELNEGREEKYDSIKKSLPCFTFNFSFNDYKKTENIKSSTGLIYLDIDDVTDINLENPYILASWKSLSEKGRGVLVKVNGLSKDNFKLNYSTIAEKIGVKVDKNAGKPTQYCIHSYDENLYLNNDSQIWNCIDNDKKDPKRSYPSSSPNLKRKDRSEMGLKSKIKFNNINEYDFGDKPFIFFEDEKEMIASVNVPTIIEAGNRNSILCAIAYQIKALNPEIEYLDLSRIIHSINIKRCFPKLSKNEVDGIIDKIHDLDNPEPMMNEKRRIIYNPQISLTRKEKFKILNTKLGKRRSEKTIKLIKECVDNWKTEIHGKITQKSLAVVTGLNIKTIKKYYKLFKEDIGKVNHGEILNRVKKSK